MWYSTLFHGRSLGPCGAMVDIRRTFYRDLSTLLSHPVERVCYGYLITMVCWKRILVTQRKLTDNRERKWTRYGWDFASIWSNHANNRKFPPGYLKQSRVPQIVAGNVTVQILGCLVFFARVYSRAILTGIWKSEDWVLSVAWVGSLMHFFLVLC